MTRVRLNEKLKPEFSLDVAVENYRLILETLKTINGDWQPTFDDPGYMVILDLVIKRFAKVYYTEESIIGEYTINDIVYCLCVGCDTSDVPDRISLLPNLYGFNCKTREDACKFGRAIYKYVFKLNPLTYEHGHILS